MKIHSDPNRRVSQLAHRIQEMHGITVGRHAASPIDKNKNYKLALKQRREPQVKFNKQISKTIARTYWLLTASVSPCFRAINDMLDKAEGK